ncbi:MAG TPA: crossover junction endodeoxyribonuclease RuvC [Polyangiaceae bacterium]|nr:crossover junction endodeoxyribonuclease RuvC [Polyangiaceae bacterium]
MLALGIDPGTLHLGWGVVRREGTRLQHVAHGVVNLPAGAPLAERLLGISDQLSEIIATHQPSVGSVETLFFHKDAQAAVKLGHARGVVLLCLQRASVETFEYAPARVKLTVVGNGQAGKDQVAQMVRAMLSLTVVPKSDAADALALAITHLRIGTLMRALSNAEGKRAPANERLMKALGRRLPSSRAR